jgi:hypothetical protein
MKQHYSLIYMLLACALLVGCGRGCTTTTTLESEEKTVTRKGQEVLLKASVLDYRHSRGTKGNPFNRSVSHSYGLSFVAKIDGHSFGEFFEETVADPDLVDLTTELKRAKVNLSKDKSHLGLGIDGEVVKVVHILDGKSIQISSTKWQIPDNMKWSELRLESYPHPGIMLMNEVRENCDFVSTNSEQLHNYLDSKHPSDTMHRVLISQWPECRVAKEYLTDKRRQKFMKNSKWKSYAVKRGIEVLRSSYISSWDVKETYAFLEGLNSPELMRIMDSTCVADWGRGIDPGTTESLKKRMKSTRNPMNSTQQLEVIIEAGTNFDEFLRTGNSNYKREATSCLAILMASGDTLTAHNFLDDALVRHPGKYSDGDFFDAVYDNYNAFTPAQQRLVDRETPNLFVVCKDYYRSNLFDKVQNIVSCDQLSDWLKDYPDDLDFNKLPAKCQGTTVKRRK